MGNVMAVTGQSAEVNSPSRACSQSPSLYGDRDASGSGPTRVFTWRDEEDER